MLERFDSLCDSHAPKIVSSDKKSGNPSKYIAYNPSRHLVRHFKLDEEIKNIESLKECKCCDYALLNDDRNEIYLIELKGGHQHKAILQLQSAYSMLKNELKDYTFFLRCITCSRVTKLQNSDKVLLRKHFGKVNGREGFIIKNSLCVEYIS